MTTTEIVVFSVPPGRNERKMMMSTKKSPIRKFNLEALARAIEERESAEQHMALVKSAAVEASGKAAKAVERARDDLVLRERILAGAVLQALQSDPSISGAFVRVLKAQ
jgi:hypothetical protein